MVRVALSTEASVLLSSRGKAAKLPMFVHSIAKPIDSRVRSDGLVGNINQNYLKIFVGRILQYIFASIKNEQLDKT